MSILFRSEFLKPPEHGVTNHSDNRRKKSKRKKFDKNMGPPGKLSSKHEDLILSGFRCQLFIDDAARQEVEDGRLLIPWMGDKSLLIDRYDCRGSLYNREEFDPKLSNTTAVLTPEEWQIEQDCDVERYFALKEDDIELSHLEEEEEKRQVHCSSKGQDYKQMGFIYTNSKDGDSASLLQQYYDLHRDDHIVGTNLTSYRQSFGREHSYRGDEQYEPEMAAEDVDKDSELSDYDVTPEHIPQESTTQIPYENVEQASLPGFKPPTELNVPAGMELPDTEKQHAIIEKTALFLSKQSGQMEIVLKAKQSGNPQFAFLEFGNWLNPYYRHILNAIKVGNYKPVISEARKGLQKSREEPGDREAESDDSSDEYELHPSLRAPVKTEAEVTTYYSTIISRQSAVAAKTNKIATTEDVMKVYMATKYSLPTENEELSDDNEKTQTVNDEEGTENCQRYDSKSAVSENIDGVKYSTCNQASNPQSLQEWIEEAAKAYGCDPIQYQTYLASFGYLPPPPPPDEEPQQKRVNEPPPPPPPPGVDDSDVSEGESGSESCSLKSSRSPLGGSPDRDHTETASMQVLDNSKVQKDNEDDRPEESPIIPPPPDLKVVVDKLAVYVGKNGEEFEEGIRRKNDPRFEFLNPGHLYHPYYLFRKAQHESEMKCKQEKERNEAEAKASKPVVFMLKKKKQEKPKTKGKVVAVFTAEDEDQEDSRLEGYKPNQPSQESKQEVQSDKEAGEYYKSSKNRAHGHEAKITSGPKITDEEAKTIREKQMQLERRRRAAAFIGKLKQQQQQLEGSSSESATCEKKTSSLKITDGPESRRHFREKRYFPGEEDLEPEKKRVTEEMMEKFIAIREKIISNKESS